MLLPVGRLAILKIVPRAQFLAAMSFITIPGLIGPLIGPALGGWLVQVATWHWIFLINLPIGIIGALLTLNVMPLLKNTSLPRFDLSGYILLVVGMVCLSLSLEGLSDKGNLGIMMILLMMGIAASVAYIFHASRQKKALFRADLFKNRCFSIGIIGNLFARLGGGSLPFLLPLLLQLALGYTPLQAGLMMMPLVLGAMTIKRTITPIIKRFGYRRVLVTNTILVGLGIATAAAILSGFTVRYEHNLLSAFHATFICMGLITMAAAWIFWQLEPDDKRCDEQQEAKIGLPESS